MRLALAALALVSACGTASAPERVAGTTDDELYGATGQVVSVPGKPVRFCAPLAVAGVGGPPPPPGYCEYGVDVEGVDLDALEERREVRGAVEGYAALTGTWDGTTLRVQTQGKRVRNEDVGLFTDPPCPAPGGGWPHQGANANLDIDSLDRYRGQHADEVVQIAYARPSDTQVVAYLLTTGDVAAAEDALRPAYGTSLCVTRSRYTRAELDAARQDVQDHFEQERIYSGAGEGIAEDGQVETTAEAVLETPGLRALVARHPAGLVRVLPWLKPVDGRS